MQHAIATALDVVEVSYRCAGTAALHRDSVIQRCFRDVHTARMHVGFGLEGFRGPGREALGRA
jgi:alkylation response protein AidB-like acyl-CoA dehydrogenase